MRKKTRRDFIKTIGIAAFNNWFDFKMYIIKLDFL